ncbi:hypothetical protein [Antarcticibacterium flavum]
MKHEAGSNYRYQPGHWAGTGEIIF